MVDLVHVLGYLWGSVWCFFAEGDPAAEAWVLERALAVLGGKAREVAAGIRRRATAGRLGKKKRTKADACAKYLANKADYLDYPKRRVAPSWGCQGNNGRRGRLSLHGPRAHPARRTTT